MFSIQSIKDYFHISPSAQPSIQSQGSSFWAKIKAFFSSFQSNTNNSSSLQNRVSTAAMHNPTQEKVAVVANSVSQPKQTKEDEIISMPAPAKTTHRFNKTTQERREERAERRKYNTPEARRARRKEQEECQKSLDNILKQHSAWGCNRSSGLTQLQLPDRKPPAAY